LFLNEYTGRGVRIAVVDSGVHAGHPHVGGVEQGVGIRDDGLLDEDGKVVRVVENIDRVAGLARNEKGKFSVGGMTSKLQAVKVAVEAGIPTYIASGRQAGRIPAIAAGKPVGTRFIARGEAVSG